MNNVSTQPLVVLMAEDDEEDRLLIRKGLQKCGVHYELHSVEDGQELLDYLGKRGPYIAPASAPTPGVILLDLNMPRKDGFAALREIRENTALRHIPVVVLTTSQREQDVLQSYGLGANSFISKPVTFDALVDVMRSIGKYWFEVVRLPNPAGDAQ